MPPKRPKTAASPGPLVQLSLFAEEANLARVYPEENMWRFYRMELWPDLLGGALLMRQWGRIGTEGRRRLDPYPDVGAALNALATIERADPKALWDVKLVDRVLMATAGAQKPSDERPDPSSPITRDYSGGRSPTNSPALN